MKKTNRESGKAIRLALAIVAIALVSSLNSASAATLFWDGDGVSPQAGGAGTWNTTTAHFSTTSGGTVDQTWVNGTGNDATFDTAAGAVTLAGPITVGAITTTIGGYTIGNGNGIGGGANTLD